MTNDNLNIKSILIKRNVKWTLRAAAWLDNHVRQRDLGGSFVAVVIEDLQRTVASCCAARDEFELLLVTFIVMAH